MLNLQALVCWWSSSYTTLKDKNYPKYFDRLDLGMQCITSSIAMLSGNIVVWKYFENLMKIFWLFWCGRNIWECHWPVPNFKPCYARNLDGDQLCDHVVHTNIWWWLHYTIVWSYRARTFDDDHNICTIVMINPPRYQWQWCDMVQHLGLVTVHQHHHRVIKWKIQFCLGNTSFKKECFLSGIAQITSPPPPLPPIRATCTTFFGRQKRRFSAYYRTK